jgi:hypothetical protein
MVLPEQGFLQLSGERNQTARRHHYRATAALTAILGHQAMTKQQVVDWRSLGVESVSWGIRFHKAAADAKSAHTQTNVNGKSTKHCNPFSSNQAMHS